MAVKSDKRKLAVTIADHSGYCFGVKRAMDILERAAEEWPERVFTLGELIHNTRAVKSFENRGIRVAPDAWGDFAAGSTVVLPTHGTTAAVRKSLSGKGLKLVDAACPRVLAVRNRIEGALSRGRRVFIAGEAKHAEVVFYQSLSGRDITVIGSPEQARRLRPGARPCFLAAQTTFSPDNFARIEEILRGRCADIDVFTSICGHTLKSQQAARALAGRCDVMIVVGGKTSSNTRRLTEACESAGARTFQVEGAGELRAGNFKGAEKVGVTAGASTPHSQVMEIVDWLAERFDIGGG